MVGKGGGAAAFGAIGGAMTGVEGENLSARLNKVIKGQKFKFSIELEKQLRHELGRVGFKVHFIKIKRAEKTELFENYKNIRYTKADVILDVVVREAGYSTEHFMSSPEWRPDVKISIGLGKPGQDKLLYSETFMYGYHNFLMSETDLDAPGKYMFEEEDVFAAGDKVIVAGLMDAAHAVARQIASKLKH